MVTYEEAKRATHFEDSLHLNGRRVNYEAYYNCDKDGHVKVLGLAVELSQPYHFPDSSAPFEFVIKRRVTDRIERWLTELREFIRTYTRRQYKNK